jgi:hypothetical protein
VNENDATDIFPGKGISIPIDATLIDIQMSETKSEAVGQPLLFSMV